MKVAVFGPSGMLGRQVVRELGQDAEPIYRRMFELLDRDSVARAVEGCDAAINCAGVIPARNDDIVEMIRVNAEFPHILVGTGLPKVLLVSTDCVFSGRATKRYLTTSLPDPRDYYGRSKSTGEVVAPNTMVVRTSFIGCEHGFMRWLIGVGTVAHATGETQQVTGYKNALWTGSTVQEVAKALVAMLATDDGFQPGIAHLATKQVINKYDLAVKIIEARELNVEVIPSYQPTINRALEPTHILPDIDTALEEYKCSSVASI